MLGPWTWAKLLLTLLPERCGLFGYVIGKLFFFFSPESLLNRTQEARMGCCDFKGLLLVKPQGQSPGLSSSVPCRLCDVRAAATSKGESRVREAGQFLEHQMVIAKQ